MADKEVANLFVRFTGSFANFSNDLGKLGKELEKFGKKTEKIGKTFTKAFTVPLGGIGIAAIAAANQMDDAFDSIRAGTGKTGAELESLNKSFKDVAQTATQGVGETAKVITDLSGALNLTGAPLEALSKQVLGVAEVTGQDLAGTIEGTTKIMNAWKVSTEDQASTMDYLFKVAQASGENFGKLSSEVAQFQPTLSALGMGLKEGAAMFGQLNKAGADSGVVIGGLRKAVQGFSAAGIKDTGEALAVTFDAIKNAKSDTDAASKAMSIFGGKAGPQMASLIRAGKLSIDDFVASIDASSETISKAQEDTAGFAEAWKQLRNVLTVQLGEAGAPMIAALAEGMKALIPLIQSLGQAFQAMGPQLQGLVIGFLAILASIGPVIAALGFFFGWMSKAVAVVPYFVSAVTGLLTAIGGALALLLTPLGLVAAAVGVAIAVWYEWDNVVMILEALWEKVSEVFNNVAEVVVTSCSEAWDGFQMFCSDVAAAFSIMGQAVLQSVADTVNGVVEWFTTKLTAAKDAVLGFTDSVSGFFKDMYTSVVGESSVPDMVDGVGQHIGRLQSNMVVPVQSATAAVALSFEQLQTKVKAAGKEGEKASKELAGAWTKTMTDLKSVMSDLDHSIDPLRQKITALLQAKDFSGLQAMADGFKNSKEQLEQFRASLKDAAGDYKEIDNRQKDVTRSVNETTKALYELRTGRQYIDDTTASIIKMMDAGDMKGIENLGKSMAQTEEGAQKFNDALSQSTEHMRQMQQQGEELVGMLGDSLGSMFENFGLSGGVSSPLGKGVSGLIGQLLGGSSGVGSLLDGLGGGGKSGGGSGLLSSISSLFGNDASNAMTKGIGDLFGSTETKNSLGDAFFNLSGELPDAMKLDELGGASDDLLGSFGELGGGMSEMSSMMGEVGGYAGAIKTGLEAISQIGKNAEGTGKGLGAIGGGTVGAIFGGPAGAQIGAQLGALGGFIGGMFGGKKDAQTMARKKVENWLEEIFSTKNVSFFDKEGKMKPFSGNFVFGSGGQFSKPGQGEDYQKSAGFKTFDALGKGLTNLLGITEDIGGQIGKILSDNLSGNIDNARILMKELGVTQEQMTEAFVKMGESGEMSWHAVEVGLQGVSSAFGEGLVAIGDFAGGFQQIVDSGGDGMDAIAGVKNAAIEAGEAGIKNFDQWRASLLAAGKSVEEVDAFFQALQQRGLTTFDAIKNASTRDIGGVIADMESLSPALAAQWHTAQEEAQKYADTISSIPDDSTKNVTLNVKANIDDDARKALDVASGTSTDVPAPHPFAAGGIVRKPVFGMVGESGPEAIVPLNRAQGLLGKGGTAGNTYNIDLRGAQPGVEVEVRRVLREFKGEVVMAAMNATADAVQRGGSFANVFGQ